MTFHEHRLPEDVERGAQGGPRFNTTITTLSSGFEQRNQNWEYSRAEWDIGYGIQKRTDYQAVISFFYARRGRAIGFRFKDWSDYQATDEPFGVGDGVTTVFQLIKTYSDRSNRGTPLAIADRYIRTISKPVPATVKVYDYDTIAQTTTRLLSTSLTQINSLRGTITLITPLPTDHELWWTGEFDVPVRFDVDKLDVALTHYDAGAVPDIPIVEIRV